MPPRQRSAPPKEHAAPVAHGRPLWTDKLIAICTVLLALITGAQVCLVLVSFGLIRNDQRAWVGVTDITLGSGEIKEGAIFTADVTLRNSGKSPALNVQGWVNIEVVDPRTFTPSYGQPSEERSIGVLQPNASSHARLSVDVHTKEDAEALKLGTKKFCVWGYVTYNDVFERSRLRHAYFAANCDYSPAESAWNFLTKGNTAD